MEDRLVSETVMQSLRYVVIAAIPDADVLDAEIVAKLFCERCGSTFDWEFNDSSNVVFRFSKLDIAKAFKSYCALNRWRVR
jgi:hypothetical protein